jgi:menaquinone-9 beta-reductase
MESCDVLIVGAGPAGSSCAWGLRNTRLNVVVMDRQSFPRDKVCGGWITPGVLTDLEIDPIEYSKGRVLQPIFGFRVGCIGDSAVKLDFGKPVSYGILRREFDDFLIRRSGARLRLGTGLATLERDSKGPGWVANQELAASVVVGAGGHFCPVARILGAKAADDAAVVGQEAEFPLEPRQLAGCRVLGGMPELYFCPDMKGYGWCFRKGGFLNVGLGRVDPHQLSSHVRNFLQFLKSTGRISFDLPPMRGHAYLLRGAASRKASAGGLLLIGDSTGVAHPMSGEGIRPAIESGLRAAKAIANGNQAEFDRDRIEPQDPWPANIGRFLPVWMVRVLARALLRTQWFDREIVIKRFFLNSN